MKSDHEEWRLPALEYLNCIEALQQEMEAGIHAVGANAISLLVASVARQQELCTGLCLLTAERKLHSEHGGSPRTIKIGLRSSEDYALAERIQVATSSLRSLNDRYAALLKHSGESIRLFAGLCQSYQGLQEPSSADSATRTGWSCKS